MSAAHVWTQSATAPDGSDATTGSSTNAEAEPVQAEPEDKAAKPGRAKVGRAMAIAQYGFGGTPVTIEASINSGIPGIDVVGLPDASVSEAKKRVRAAISNLGIGLSQQRITVSLSPGDVRKEGTGFDLGIAIAILSAEGRVPTDTSNIVFCGELGLDNRLHPVSGVLPTVLAAKAAGVAMVAVPWANEAEARIASDMRILAANDLARVVNVLGGTVAGPHLAAVVKQPARARPSAAVHDLAEVKGQDAARFALEVAAAGGHHMLMTGSPGAGKTLLAECMPSILPPLTEDEACQVLSVRSIIGTLDEQDDLDVLPPFEAPHHTSSRAALLGSVNKKSVGIVARANYGVLFLDEAPEFDRNVLEGLREPLDGGMLSLAQAGGTMRVPARFQLIAAANPCACGASGAAGSRCVCSSQQRRRYRQKLSAPFLDRIDIQMDIMPVAVGDVAVGLPAESSASVAVRVARARAAQRSRYEGCTWGLNARTPGEFLRSSFKLTHAQTAPLERAMDSGRLTMRGYDRVLRLAATIADLDGRERPQRTDLMAALGLRMREGS